MGLVEKIRKSSLGLDLSDQQAGKLADLGTVSTLQEGQYLIEERTRDDTLYVLLAGKLEVVKKSGVGEDITLHVLREGDMTGELSFVDRTEHSLGLRALSDCEVFSLKRDDFEAMITREPELVFKVMCALMRSAHRILHTMNHQHIELSNYIYKQHGRY